MVPLSIRAKTAEALTIAMLNNNLKYNKTFHYFDIQKDGTGWIAWYMQDLTEADIVGKLNASYKS